MDPKSLLASKTFWANVAALVAAVSGYFTGASDIGSSATAAVMALMNIVLRLFTKQPIGTPPDAPSA